MLSEREGREWVWDLLSRGHVFATSFVVGQPDATAFSEGERNLALSGQAALAVEEIDYAAQRVADKTYGYCERCFQPIPKPRLRALPYARLCVACKSGGLSRR